LSTVNIDHTKALAVFRAASRLATGDKYRPSSPLREELEAIVTGPHLTYRYVLVTALLAKATSADANCLALQAGAPVRGAYDARSLCHKVIVPHEPDLLGKALGGSNEPYLNKPARFQQISLGNAVRPGKDQRTLQGLHALLRKVVDAAQARIALQDALFFAVRRNRANKREIQGVLEHLRGGRGAILAFIEAFVSKSMNGETAALAVGTLFWVMGLGRGAGWTVQVHPVNEAGSSSNEISDVDVRDGETLVFTAEVKDKAFLMRDVMHAIGKVKAAGLPRLHFITGPRAEQVDGSEEALAGQAAMEGIELVVLDLHRMAETVMAFAPADLDLYAFAARVSGFAEQSRAKADTFSHLKETMERITQ
jgi:hypothetical protein